MSLPPVVLESRNLTKRVATANAHLTILSEVSLQIKSGESAAVVGVSGSGKSTLLGLLAGLDLPTSGEVILFNHALNKLDEDGRAAVRAQHVGFVFQSFQLLPALTALENVLLPLEIRGEDDPTTKAQMMLERVGLADRASHYPNQLSGGEQQRVAIARAFVTSPSILFADEPTGNLDNVTGQKIIELLFELNREKATTLVMVTHDAHLADRCDRVIKLEAGRVTGDNIVAKP